MDYRNFSKNEIHILIQQGCSAENWEKIFVKENPTLERIKNVHFSGEIKLGSFTTNVEIIAGITRPCGLYDSYINNCIIHDNVYISNVKNLVNYRIKKNVVINNVGVLATTGKSSFGNGTNISVLNEGGGRKIFIFNNLSAQIAYIYVTYRQRKILIQQIENMIKKQIENNTSTKGSIENHVRIDNCNKIVNTNIGEYSVISGVQYLENGSIVSVKEDPCLIGDGVVMTNFIAHSGSKIESGAILSNCFVGQGVRIGKLFSAENSLFFANSEGYLSEVSNIFAGPYTVTHHKSTLLIAGMFSFFNAGSGTNQSNHMYKLGPLHQGIMERGSKTGSSSYLLWPCRVGAFSVVLGKHYANFDTSNLPFSYINEKLGKSILIPAMNLFTVGTKRDSEKWSFRDNRKDSKKLDLIHFEILNPFTIGKILDGLKDLTELYEKIPVRQEEILYNGIHISRLMLKTSKKYYEIAIKIFIGNTLVKKLDSAKNISTFESLIVKISPKKSNLDKWIDLSGLICSYSDVETLLQAIEEGEYSTIQEVQEALTTIYDNYEQHSWMWCVGLIEERLITEFKNITKNQIIAIIQDWKDNFLKLNNMILKDAKKEFDEKSQIGYGIDGDKEDKTKDFEAVRGSFDENKFVLQIKEESKFIQEKADYLIRMIKNINDSVE